MFIPKFSSCLGEYSKKCFFHDTIAGAILATIAIPLAICLALASGMTAEKNLYIAMIVGFIFCLLIGRNVTIGGATGAFSVTAYNIIQKQGLKGLIIAAIMIVIFFVIMRTFKLGRAIKLLPNPITAGFTNGIAIVIFLAQIKDFLGLKISSLPTKAIYKITYYIEHLDTINYSSLLIGITSLLIIILWPKINKVIPGTIIAVMFTTIFTLIFDLPTETIGSTLGEISRTLPSSFMPTDNMSILKQLALPSLTFAILVKVEFLLSRAEACATVDNNYCSNRKLIAKGFPNIFSGLEKDVPVTGVLASATDKAKKSGRTPIAGIIQSMVSSAMILLLMPVINLIPMASLSAVLMIASYKMGDWKSFKAMVKAPKSHALIFLLVLFLILTLNLILSISIALVRLIVIKSTRKTSSETTLSSAA